MFQPSVDMESSNEKAMEQVINTKDNSENVCMLKISFQLLTSLSGPMLCLKLVGFSQEMKEQVRSNYILAVIHCAHIFYLDS